MILLDIPRTMPFSKVLYFVSLCHLYLVPASTAPTVREQTLLTSTTFTTPTMTSEEQNNGHWRTIETTTEREGASAEKMTSDLSLESTMVVTQVTTTATPDTKILTNLSYFSIADFEAFSKIWSCWTSLRFYPDGHLLVKSAVKDTKLSQLPFNSAIINLHVTNLDKIYYVPERDIFYIIDTRHSQVLTFRDRLVPVSIGINYPSEEVNFVFDAILALDKLYTIERFAANQIGLFVSDFRNPRDKLRLSILPFLTLRAKLQYFRHGDGAHYLFLAIEYSTTRSIFMIYNLQNGKLSLLPNLPIDINASENSYIPFNLQQCNFDRIILSPLTSSQSLYVKARCRTTTNGEEHIVVKIRIGFLTRNLETARDPKSTASTNPNLGLVLSQSIVVLFVGVKKDFQDLNCIGFHHRSIVLCFRETALYFVDSIVEVERSFELPLYSSNQSVLFDTTTRSLTTDIITRTTDQLSAECQKIDGKLFNNTLEKERRSNSEFVKIPTSQYNTQLALILYVYPAFICALVCLCLYIILRSMLDIRKRHLMIKSLRRELYLLNAENMDAKNHRHSSRTFAAPTSKSNALKKNKCVSSEFLTSSSR